VLAYPEFVDDVKAAVKHARKHSPKAKIILWGRSLGASLAMAAVAEGAKVDELIVESPYLPTQAVFTDRINAMRKTAGSSRVTRVIASSRLEPFKVARKIKAFTHFIVGDSEKLITQEDVTKLSNITKGMSTLFVAKDCDHLEFPNKTMDDFPTFVKETIESRVHRPK
jgi:alpha-beta hydrolase superfamily lysophospholipase